MAKKQRPYISVYFRCCGVYQRIYRAEGATDYVGRCPKCLGTVEVKVDPTGTDDRFFEAVRER
jgi:hypothetical protein